MSVSVDTGPVHGWDGLWIRRGQLAFGLVPAIGGRLMSLRWHDHELSFVHPDHAGKRLALDATDVRALKRATGFVHWGGDKTWLAPQERWQDTMPFLDLDAGPYAVAVERPTAGELRVTLQSRVCRETGARVSRTLIVRDGEPDFTVVHALENASAHAIQWALWDVHQLCGPGIVHVPRRDGSPFRDGVKAFPAEGDSEGARADVVRPLGGVAAIDCRRKRWFKFGVDAEEGWALGVVDTPRGLVGYRKEVPVAAGGVYAHACVTEVYNDPHRLYFEMEAHGPLTALAPGETTTLVERRRVFDVAAWPASEADVRAFG